MESFDNSHLFGTFYVGGMVVFDDFIPNKNLYRKYKISTEVKDDLGAMKEVLYRRYFKILMGEVEAPDLLPVNKDSKLFLFLTRIQEEVHRYAIAYHRNIKAKGALSSVLDVVPGIGEVRKKELLKKFGSLKKMKEASLDELSEIVGKEVGKKLQEYLKEV